MTAPSSRFARYHFEEQKALLQTEIIGEIKHSDENKNADLWHGHERELGSERQATATDLGSSPAYHSLAR